MKSIENRCYGMKLLIRAENIEKKSSVFHATAVYEKHDTGNTTEMKDASQQDIQQSVTQVIGS